MEHRHLIMLNFVVEHMHLIDVCIKRPVFNDENLHV